MKLQTPLARYRSLIGVALALIFAGALWWIIASLSGGKSARVEADLNAGRAGAAIESGADAAGTVGSVGGRAESSDALTRSNEEEIRNAQGADEMLDPAVDDAGRRSLCRRAAYRDSPECVQHADPE